MKPNRAIKPNRINKKKKTIILYTFVWFDNPLAKSIMQFENNFEKRPKTNRNVHFGLGRDTDNCLFHHTHFQMARIVKLYTKTLKNIENRANYYFY